MKRQFQATTSDLSKYTGTLALRHYYRLMDKDATLEVYDLLLAECEDYHHSDNNSDIFIFKDHSTMIVRDSIRFHGKADILLGFATKGKTA